MQITSKFQLTSSSDVFDSMIRIKVGKDGAIEIFDVHKGLLKFYSGYFQVAINNIKEGRFAESKENMITLDEDVDVFKAFKNWLYTRGLPALPIRLATGNETDTWSGIFVKLWCFGDRREIPLLQNECINALLSGMMCRTTILTGRIPYIYANTITGSPLRDFITGIVAQRVKDNTDAFAESIADCWCKDSLSDLVKLLVLRPEVASWDVLVAGACEWHVHEEGVKCKK